MMALPSERKAMVEHLVLSKPKEGVSQQKLEAYLTAFNTLASLDCVEYLHAGAASGNPVYKHAFFSRFSSQEALADYYAHPRLHAIWEEHGVNTVDDFVSVDWEWPTPTPPSYWAEPLFLRILLLKPRHDLGEIECADVVQILSGYENRELFPSIAWVSYGEGINSNPEFNKGFRWGFVCAFWTLKDLHEFDNNERHIGLHHQKLMPNMEEIVAMNCCIPPHSQNAN